MLERLVNEIEVLGRSEARFGVSARMTIGALIADYLYGTFDIVEPPIPTYPAYKWPKGTQSYE
jgi:hypothetical protein